MQAFEKKTGSFRQLDRTETKFSKSQLTLNLDFVMPELRSVKCIRQAEFMHSGTNRL